MKYYLSKEIYTEQGVIDGYIGVADGKIACIGQGVPEGDQENFGDQRIIPGLIDTHLHGMYGYGLFYHDGISRDEVMEEIRGYLLAATTEGITSVFPTPKHDVIEAVAEVALSNPRGAKVMGIHSEGPWYVRVGEGGRQMKYPPASLEMAKKIVSDAKGLLKLLALAPEYEGIDPIIEYLHSQGVTIGYAHSNLNYEDATRAIETKGITVATHLSNIMTGLHHRDVGGCGALLLNDKVDCEIICNGWHVAVEYLKILFACKDASRFMMISDGNYIGGAKPGRYLTTNGDQEMIMDEQGVLRDTDGKLRGNTKSILYGVKVLTEKVGIPMETALRVASYNAAKKYGFADRKGSLAVGKDADFAVIDADFKAIATCVEGAMIHRAENPAIAYNPSVIKKFNM